MLAGAGITAAAASVAHADSTTALGGGLLERTVTSAAAPALDAAGAVGSVGSVVSAGSVGRAPAAVHQPRAHPRTVVLRHRHGSVRPAEPAPAQVTERAPAQVTAQVTEKVISQVREKVTAQVTAPELTIPPVIDIVAPMTGQLVAPATVRILAPVLRPVFDVARPVIGAPEGPVPAAQLPQDVITAIVGLPSNSPATTPQVARGPSPAGADGPGLSLRAGPAAGPSAAGDVHDGSAGDPASGPATPASPHPAAPAVPALPAPGSASGAPGGALTVWGDRGEQLDLHAPGSWWTAGRTEAPAPRNQPGMPLITPD